MVSSIGADSPTLVDDIDFAQLQPARLARMRAALDEIEECYRVLRKADLNIVGECLRGQGTFYEMDHYPQGDVNDWDTASQYYYHAHRGCVGEHGHFHTFLRADAVLDGVSQASGHKAFSNQAGDLAGGPTDDKAPSHLVAISMDNFGYPIGMFTTNRWVTEETWYAACDVIRLLDAFRIDHAYPSWPLNRWLSAMLIAFGPQIEALLLARDSAIEERAHDEPRSDVLEDRALEIISQIPISVSAQAKAVNAALTAMRFADDKPLA